MISVFIVVAARLYGDGLTQVLASDGRVRVSGTAVRWSDALDDVVAVQPQIVLVDPTVADAYLGLELLLEKAPATKIVAFGVSEVEHDLVGWAEAGVSGYVGRDATVSDLVCVLEGVVRDELVCSPRVAAVLLRRVKSLAAGVVALDEPRLTSRESEIIRLIYQGLSNKEIAQQLRIAVPTVKNHVHSILEKLGAKSRADAAAILGERRPRQPVDTQ